MGVKSNFFHRRVEKRRLNLQTLLILLYLDSFVLSALEELNRLRSAENITACHDLFQTLLERPLVFEHAFSSANLLGQENRYQAPPNM